MTLTRVVFAVCLLLVGIRPAVSTCPFSCNNHGFCVGLNDELCACYDQWKHDEVCSARVCPVGPAWQTFPDANGDVHGQLVECSNRGECDTATGLCICDFGFNGEACERLWCDENCSGHGTCVSLQEAARQVNQRNLFIESHFETSALNWEAERIHGCVCDPGWEGVDCNTKSCPLGDDPLTTGVYETQVIRTLGDHTDEVQLIEITGATDTNEVQLVRFEADPTGVIPYTGEWFLTFDSQDHKPFCNLCNISTIETTGSLDAEITAEDLELALEALTNIDSVEVSRTSIAGRLGFEWTITFDGFTVGGDVPELELDADRITGGSIATSIATVTDGSEISGSINLSYDDTADGVHPIGTIGLDTISVDLTLRDRFLREAIEVFEATPENGVIISRTVDGGPGLSWLITFTGTIGNMSELTCDPSSLTGDAAIGCQVTTIQDGNFLDGNFSVTLNGFDTTALDWNITADDMKTALVTADPSIGTIDVSRTRIFLTSNENDWSGTYDWTVTFRSFGFDYITMTADNGTLTGAGGQEGAVVGTAESPVTGTETNPDGAEVSEVQVLECSCPADCEGGFRLVFVDGVTEQINHDDTVSELQAKLEALQEINGILVTLHGSSTGAICDPDGVSAAITFAFNGGDLPSLKVGGVDPFTMTSPGTPAGVDFSIKAGFGKLGTYGGVTQDGTRVMRPCSDRGICQSDGTCRCFFGFSRSDGGGVDVNPSLGPIFNCGFQLRTISDCPGSCSQRGTCSGPPDYVCTCQEPYEGPACELVKCPAAAAWFSEPDASGEAHPITECSGRGICRQDFGGSSCECDLPFAGVACQLMMCPGPGVQPGQAGGIPGGCSGHGNCQTLQELGNFSTAADGSLLNGPAYIGWDDRKILGCVCDKEFYAGPYAQTWSDLVGYKCSSYSCPAGDDPKTYDQDFEVQTITCDATAGFFTLSFRQNTTAPIHVWHTPMGLENSLQAALEGISTIRNVTVSADSGSICHPTDTVQSSITFVSEHGDLPLLQIDTAGLTGTATVAESVKGSKENIECNRRGFCDREQGRCVCAPQYGSSNGASENGTLGDCGYLHSLWQFPFPIPDPPGEHQEFGV